jgi:hypothetical protein
VGNQADTMIKQAGSAVKRHSLSGVQVVVDFTTLRHAGNLTAEPK